MSYPILPDALRLGDDGGLLAAEELGQVAELQRDLDKALEALLRVLVELGRTGRGRNVALDIHAHGRALAAGTAQAEHDARTVVEGDDLALVAADAAVDGVGVVEVGDARDGELLAGALRDVRGAGERAGADVHVDGVHERLRSDRGDLLVVVAGEERAAVDSVVLLEQFLDADELVW